MPTPAEVARRANVHVNTIRNWTTDYAVLLSPQARGEAGARIFTDEDVDTVRTIATLRRTGMQPAEIIERIQADNTPPVVDVTPNTPTGSPQEAHNAPQGTSLVRYTPQEAHNALQARFEHFERHQDALIKAALVRGAIWGAVGATAVGALYLWIVYLTMGLG